MGIAALDDLIVAEVGNRMAVSICGSLLAELGATVVRVEEEEKPAPSDVFGASRSSVVRGKYSLGAAGVDKLVRDLAERSDILLTSTDCAASWMPATGGKGTICCDITAFGSSGPMAARDYSEFEVQAFSGLAATTGFGDGPPTPLLLPIASYLSGTYAASAVLAALRGRDEQGLAQDIEVALYDCSFLTLNTFLSSILTNPDATTTRMGNRHPTVAPWNTFRTADGWVLICAGNQGQWIRLCEAIGKRQLSDTYAAQADRITHRVEIDNIIEAWTSKQTTEAVVDTLASVQVACGPIAPVEEYVREANVDYRRMVKTLTDPATGGRYYAPGSALNMSRSPGRAPDRLPPCDSDRDLVRDLVAKREVRPPGTCTSPRPVLSGLRVIEIGQYTTAPLCARQLAHLGAEVIKIERPGGDESRTWPPHVDGRSASFRLNNADKKSLTLDLNKSDDQRTLRALLATADVLVENLKPGALTKFGLSPEAIHEVNPRIVYCSISGFGVDSLYAKRPAFDMVIQAMSGLMSKVSKSDVPLKTGISAADTMGAVVAIAAILGALRYARRTGKGQHIDLSMQDVTCWITEVAWNGADLPSPRLYACSDGYVLSNPRGADVPEENPADATVAETVDRLAAEGQRGVPVRNVREASEDEQTTARRLWLYKRAAGFDWPMLASPLNLKKTPPTVSHLAPDPDQHREEIRGSLLPVAEQEAK